ncbi:class I SAM-dependent methyltransferase [Streptomyces sp. WMMC940]|uniref:class I SAM-dependent methyltransferase n=1 Tax=Streptomyces sp. WMMC940 TaxID=3015153 RepID=UPI0022B66819|nr:class I SAM-dependent methyltransferase [Streptomyces sp. WMMC940]MCZ7462262.1 class I SAM-dependent methyltransferase [Streptomyces sp. WMMC940]
MDTSGRRTVWDTTEVADDFVLWDDTVGWLWGYPFVFEQLRLAQPDVRVLVDVGCGPGKVARRAAEDHGLQVHAVDISPRMLALAAARHGQPRITFHQAFGWDLSFLDHASADAVMSCFVLVCIARREQAEAMAAEAHRVLRPGGRFAVLNAHPSHVGVTFDSFQIGRPGGTYRAGDQIPVRLRRTDGAWVDIVDTYWPAESYHEMLSHAGFARVWQTVPLPADVRRRHGAGATAPERWATERTTPPFLLVVGER